jgi:CubicO group peptidase (beta-lactamase class C family)
VALGLVQGGKVVFEGGLGVRELGRPAPVDADTLFMIASNTKALSTLLLATEVDEGKFGWDTPVTQVYPAFRLGDAETTKQVLMRHLICACTGLPRQDLEWLYEFKNATPQSTMDLLATIQPTTRFGETFQYSNLLAAAAGYIGGHVAYPKKELGAAYDEAMRTRVFGPLGMKATTFDYGRAMAGDHATPHGMDADGHVKVATMDLDRSAIPIRPAGAAWSSVRDVDRYVQMELAGGKLPDDKVLVSERTLVARRAPQVAIGEHETYGMGLIVDTDHGVTVVHHGGDLLGFHSDMFWLPEHGVGGVILTNADYGWLLRGAYLRKVLEELFDGKAEAQEDVTSAAKQYRAEIAKERERLVIPAAAEVVAKLARHYRSKSLGDVVVTRRGPSVTFDFGEWRSTVASRKNDDGTTSMITVDPGLGGNEFVIGDKNGKKTLVVRDMQHEYVFEELP